ncbi:uncharacterized protein METZ01_LOCUS68201, partial [marine metagenome]
VEYFVGSRAAQQSHYLHALRSEPLRKE